MSDSGEPLIIGVDGGGTGCRVAIGTRSSGVLARAEGGRGNVASDPAQAIKNICNTVDAAMAKADIPNERLAEATAHLGLAGVMTQDDAAAVAVAMPFKDVAVTDDRPTALNGALGGEEGFLLSIGTGTITAAKTDGTFRSVGGWGFHVADQASGAWLGHSGLRHTLLCHDGLESHTDLTRALLAEFGDDPNTITAFSLSAKPGDYAKFAPTIIATAAQGDPWGEVIMKSGAHHLEKCLTRLGFQPGEAVCLTGGVGPHYANYLHPETLSGRVQCAGSALDGAFRLALERNAQRLEMSI